MDKLTALAISYPDFQLNQIIDPEQMDLNNLQIVNKINNVIKAFNELTQGTTGAGNITISPITEFSGATTVQQALQEIATFVKTLDTDAKRQFAELVQKNSQQDTEIQSVKSVNTRQDSRLQSLESTQTNHTQRIGAIEQKNTSQDAEINTIKQKNNEQDGRLATAEGTITKHTNQIQTINTKDVEQDRRLSEIESREILDDKFVENVEKRVKVNEGDIKQIKQDLGALESTNTSLEVTLARTSGHTQQTYNSIGKRLDSIEIPIQKDFAGREKGNVNFRIVNEDTTAVWENDIKIGDINNHNEDPTAHAEMMAVHEMDDTAHGDIREALNTHAHTKANITDFEHTHTKSEITDFAHTHTKSEISDFPTSLPANGGNADTVGGVNPVDFARTNGRHVNLIAGSVNIPDERYTNEPPSWYYKNKPNSHITEFKNATTIGLPAMDGENCTLETIVGWNDKTGGRITQFAYSGSKQHVTRYSIDENSWSGWQPLGGNTSAVKGVQRGVYVTSYNNVTEYEKKIPISTINPKKSSVTIFSVNVNHVIYIKDLRSDGIIVVSNKDLNIAGTQISWEVVEYA